MSVIQCKFMNKYFLSEHKLHTSQSKLINSSDAFCTAQTVDHKHCNIIVHD